ncbi:hypothetical protein [Bizionia sp.]|uniref:hypothetical protein n=1 Tax=Bizionia sp. TaxID=1954480 RepID=UPI003A9458DF
MKNLLFLFSIIFSLSIFSQENTNSKDLKDAQDTSIFEGSVDSDVTSFSIIENVPIYKGCSKNLDNKAQKECLNKKLNKHIGANFNTKVAAKLDLPDETVVKINVKFIISKTGEIVDIEAETPFPELEAEAIRVIKLIPKMERPGYFKDAPVSVPYFIPIKFKIANSGFNSSKDMQYPTYRGCEKSVSFEDLKNCTIGKIMDYVKVSINYDLADKLFPLDKSTQFEVSFMINEKGKTEDISAKAHKREMAAEAIRVLKRMPKMKAPGYIDGKPAKYPVKFLMTIYF